MSVNNNNRVLKQLKASYEVYEDFWPLWSKNKYNGLTAGEVQIIEVYRQNNFQITSINQKISMDNIEIMSAILQPISEKLINNYMHYKEWVVYRFQFFLIHLTQGKDLEAFLLSRIDDLQLDDSLKENLKGFGIRNINELIENNSDTEYQKPELFGQIIKFKDHILENEIKRRAPD